MKKKSVIAAAVAAGIFFCIIILCISASGNPKTMVAGALSNTANDAANIYLVDYMNDLINGGSVTVTGSLKPISGKDAKAGIKVYSDLSHMRFATTIAIREDKNLAASFRGNFNGNDLYLEFPEVSSKPYGVSVKKLSTNLPKSIFNPETGDEETKLDKNLYEYLTKLSKTVANDKNLSIEAKKLRNTYERRIVSAMLDNARVTKGSDKISAGGQQIACTVVTLDFDRKTLVDTVSEIVAAAKHDKDLEQFLLKYYSNFDYGIKDADDMVDDFYEGLDNFKRSVKEYDGDMTVWIYITKSGKRIARVDVDTDGRNAKGARVAYEMSLELGKNVRNSEEISLSIDSSEGNSLDITYSVRQNDKAAYKASVRMTKASKSGRKTTSGLSFKWDKKGSGYTLTADSDTNILSLEGKLSRKGNTYEFTMDNLETTGRYNSVTNKLDAPIADYGIKVTFDSTDRAPNPSRYYEITKMSAEDYKTLRNDAKKAIADIENTWLKKQ